MKDTEALLLGPVDAKTAILMFHGFVGSRLDFADLGERLAEQGFRVRLVRSPGHGTTPQDFHAQSPDTLLNHAREELKALREQHEEVYLIGFSMGGALATLLAAENSIDKLVLVAPYYGVTYYWYYVLPPRLWNRMLGGVVPYIPKPKQFVKVNKRESVPHIYSYGVIPTTGATTLIDLGDQAANPEVLARVTCPVLVLHSQGDEAASPQAMAVAYEHLGTESKSLVWYTDRSNHHLLWDYDSEDVKQQIIDFCLGKN